MKTNNKFNFMSSFLAFFVWGGWAYYVNKGAGDSAVLSAFTQGLYSFIITIIMIYVVTWFYNFLPQMVMKSIFTAICTVLANIVIIFMIHYFIGTENIFKTILPSQIISFIFCLIVCYKLKNAK